MRPVLLILFNLSILIVQGQPAVKQTTHQNLIWFAYMNRIDLSPKWFIGSEVQERRFVFPDKQHQLVLRSHLHYRFTPDWNVSVGFTYFLQSPQDQLSESTLMVPELRPHVELAGANKFNSRWRIDHRYRLEKRFFRNFEGEDLMSGYTTNFRARYNLTLSWLISGEDQRALMLKLSNEIHFNFGKEIVYNHFDQNRIYFAINYNVSPQLNLEAGYMNWYQQRQSGNEFYNRDILRINLIHRLKLKNNQTS